MDDQLFVVVSFRQLYSQPICSILQLENLGINHEYDPSTQEAPVVQSQFSVNFSLPKPPPKPPSPNLHWSYALLGADLHMVPDWLWGVVEDVHLSSCLFNLKTKEYKRTRPPLAPKRGGQVVSLQGHTYFMAHPGKDSMAPHPTLERYNPLRDEWEELEHIPQDAITGLLPVTGGSINATAVWDDTILLTLFRTQFWAYNVVHQKWYRVQVSHPLHCDIVGEAFVLENTIYALSRQDFDKVAAISIEREGSNDDDLVYKCSFFELISVPGFFDIEFEYGERPLSRHLVHLGGYHFCLLDSCQSLYTENFQYQRIQLTHVKLIKGEKSMTVTNKCVHEFKVERNAEFEVRHCFSLPKRKATDLKEGKTSFEFDPFPGSFLSRRNSFPKHVDKTYVNLEREVVKPFQEEENVTLPEDGPLFDVQGVTSELDAKSNVAWKASTISAVIGHPSHAYEKASLAPKASTLGVDAASERNNTDEEGHSICVVKLSSEASVSDIVYELKEFGPIKSVCIHVRPNTTRKPCAYVEFESAASKQLAIEASPTTIGGRRAVIRSIRRKVGDFVACEGDLSDMAEEAAAMAPQPVSTQVFGNTFVRQYYQILHDSPALVHRFYQDISKLVRPEDDGSDSVTTTVNAINKKILSLNYGDFRAEIKSVDAQESFSGAVQVVVTGYLTGMDNRIRNFFQCFLLAPHDQGFFILNDNFRYVESSNQPHGEQVLVDDVVSEDPVSHEQSPVPPAVQESHVFNEGDEVTRGRVLNPPENGDVPVVAEEVKVDDDSPPVVESNSKVEEGQKESYANTVKRFLFSSPAPVPREISRG